MGNGNPPAIGLKPTRRIKRHMHQPQRLLPQHRLAGLACRLPFLEGASQTLLEIGGEVFRRLDTARQFAQMAAQCGPHPRRRTVRRPG